MIQENPRCFRCHDEVMEEPVFACVNPRRHEHDMCPSAVWHPLCLMEYRDLADKIQSQLESNKADFVASILGMFGVQVDHVEYEADE